MPYVLCSFVRSLAGAFEYQVETPFHFLFILQIQDGQV